ncbi:MAG: hypothetical protein WCS98_03370 [Bacillota bacterium]|nr:hypothetical protein [Bacillota bacterium]MDD3298034.1 hypothetical protein [Bacillota bacterium]MDD3850483.1 hypothetical protein [Bacillota bacterium]MDD4707713.1 hypothetical protein [Bacillota bacterium]
MDKNICHEHIIKNKTQSWHFTCRQNSIFYRMRDENDCWTDDTKLLDNVLDDFSVDADSKGSLHLICLNTKGELIYFVYNGTHWYNKVLAAFPLDRYKLKHLTISCRSKHINVFFAVCPIKSPSVCTIQHNFWNGSKWANFKVARITSDGSIDPFYVGYDHAGTIHLVYKAPRLGVEQLYYCKFRSDYSIWGNPERITTVGGGDAYHYALTNNNDTLHLVWNYLVNGVNHIKYLQRTKISYQRAVWKNDSIISGEGADDEQPLFYIIGNTQWVVWVHKGLLFGSFSYDEGKNWTSPVRIDTPLDFKLKIYKVVLDRSVYSEISVLLAYGYEREGDIIIPVIDDVFDGEHPKAEDQKVSIDVDEDKIKEYAIEAKNFISKLVEEVGKIEGKKKEIEGMIMKQTDEIKQSCDDLEEFKKEVQRLGERLEHIKNENSGIMSSISNWQNKFKEHQHALDEMTNKHIELWEKSKGFSERGLVRKILDYFK